LILPSDPGQIPSLTISFYSSGDKELKSIVFGSKFPSLIIPEFFNALT